MAKKTPTVRMANAQSFTGMLDFMVSLAQHSCEITILPCDDPSHATVGFIVFFDHEGQEKTLRFEVQFAAEPVITLESRGPFTDEQLAAAEDLNLDPDTLTHDAQLLACVTEDGWICVDDPIRRCLGFAKYRQCQLGTEASIIHYFRLANFKQSPKELQDKVLAWRKERGPLEYRKLAAKMLGDDTILTVEMPLPEDRIER